MKITALVPALSLLLASHALAQHQTLTVDPDASHVVFSLGDVLHSVQGTFHVRNGSVDFDRSAPSISGEIIVAAGSGESGNKSRDHKMSKDVLDAPHFSDVSFAPHSYQGTINATGDSQIQVTGTFTLHGTPHELTVPMQIHIDGANCTAKTHFTVPYVKWGLKDPSTFLLRVGKEVQIELTLLGHLSPAQ
jgi:polyisoprenoid-binding protein YceI